MTKQEALEFINWANGEPQTMNSAARALRKAVHTLRDGKHLLSEYNAHLLGITAKHLKVSLK